jgi:hypothetical protein
MSQSSEVAKDLGGPLAFQAQVLDLDLSNSDVRGLIATWRAIGLHQITSAGSQPNALFNRRQTGHNCGTPNK